MYYMIYTHNFINNSSKDFLAGINYTCSLCFVLCYVNTFKLPCLMSYCMKPLEALFWLGTAGVLYMTANNIVKNVKRDIVKGAVKGRGKERRHCICW